MNKFEYDKQRALIISNPKLSVKERVQQLKWLADARKEAAAKIGIKKR